MGKQSVKIANSDVIYQHCDQLQDSIKAMKSDLCGSLLSGYEEDKMPFVKSPEEQLTGIKMEKTRKEVERVWVDCKVHNHADIVQKLGCFLCVKPQSKF